eukprot:3067330-Alexandrium_andersonii.AAC.1
MGSALALGGLRGDERCCDHLDCSTACCLRHSAQNIIGVAQNGFDKNTVGQRRRLVLVVELEHLAFGEPHQLACVDAALDVGRPLVRHDAAPVLPVPQPSAEVVLLDFVVACELGQYLSRALVLGGALGRGPS